MCGRISQKGRARDYLLLMTEGEDGSDFGALARDVYDVPPGAQPVIFRHAEGGLQAQNSTWGLVPAWAKDRREFGAKHFNARGDKVFTNGLYKRPIQRQRCLLPVDAWYEWTGEKADKKRFAFTAPDQAPMLLAGFFDVWRDRETAEQLHTFAIVTRDPQHDIAGFHDRSPVIVPAGLAWDWLSPEVRPEALLQHLLELSFPVHVAEVARAGHGAELLTPLEDLGLVQRG